MEVRPQGGAVVETRAAAVKTREAVVARARFGNKPPTSFRAHRCRVEARKILPHGKRHSNERVSTTARSSTPRRSTIGCRCSPTLRSTARPRATIPDSRSDATKPCARERRRDSDFFPYSRWISVWRRTPPVAWASSPTAKQGTAGLDVVGQVGGIGRDERIYAVRFIADRGYVVTFRQIDPLYVVDLSNPNAPTVAGELEMTGYSAYLHPVGDGLLLGVGREATEWGGLLGTQVSLFDVSDANAPRLVDRFALEGDGGSEVEWDHHAFLYWEPEQVAVIPIQYSREIDGTGY